jgi:hypothetical protein
MRSLADLERRIESVGRQIRDLQADPLIRTRDGWALFERLDAERDELLALYASVADLVQRLNISKEAAFVEMLARQRRYEVHRADADARAAVRRFTAAAQAADEAIHEERARLKRKWARHVQAYAYEAAESWDDPLRMSCRERERRLPSVH